jgi:putative ABC transport system permease protein
VETLLQDFRFGLRMFRKSPGFTAVAILTLALSIGASTAIFSAIEAVLLRPLPYAHPSQLVRVVSHFGNFYGPVSLPDLEEIRKQAGGLKQLALLTVGEVPLTGHGVPEEIFVARVSVEFFPLLGIAPLHGRVFVPTDFEHGNDHKVILSADFWKGRLGGDPNVIGGAIQLNGLTYAIVGVMPGRFDFPSPTDIWIPFVPTPAEQTSREKPLFCDDLGRLAPGSTVPQLQSELNTIATRLARAFPDSDLGIGFTDSTLRSYFVGGAEAPLLALFAATGFVLLVACANVGNLYLARGWSRIHELAIRAALGASRSRMIRQLLVEALVLALAGGAIGLLLAECTMAGLRSLRLLGTSLVQNVRIDGRVLWFTFAIAVLAGVAFGLAPAFVISRNHLMTAIREAGSGREASSASPRKSRLQQLLIVGEVASALVLVVGAALALQSFVRLSAVPLGFRTAHILTIRLELPQQRFSTAAQYTVYSQEILQEVRAAPGVESASSSFTIPLSHRQGGVFLRIDGRPLPSGSRGLFAVRNGVTPGYFRTLGIPILAGRDFNDNDRADSEPVAIVDQAFARRYFGTERPIGQRISGSAGDPVWYEIVGEVGNVHSFSPLQKQAPLFYRPLAQQSLTEWGTPPEMDLLVRTATEPVALARTIEDRIWSAYKDQPISHLAAMSEVVATTYAEPKSLSLLMSLFGGLGVALALMGVYGLISYSIAQRTREIGIRIALGAESGDVLRLVVGQGAKLILTGVAAGLVASLTLTRLMRGLLFGISATDPLTFVVVSILLILAGLAACYVPARRAMRIDPMVALRYE